MIKEAILKLAQRNDLTAQEALEVMNEIMDGKASPVQMSSYPVSYTHLTLPTIA